MREERYILKVEIVGADEARAKYRVKYVYGSTLDMVLLPAGYASQATHISCTTWPGDTREPVSKAQAAAIVRGWRREALDVVVVDRRKAIESVTLPSGHVLSRSSHLLELVKAFQQWQRGTTVLAHDDAQAIKLWIADRLPFGVEAVEAIKDMDVLDQLEDV